MKSYRSVVVAAVSSPNCVSPVRHPVTVSDPIPVLPRLPRLPLRTLDDLAACARFIHEDRCSWMGDDTHPCTCGVPRTIRAAAAIWADPDPTGE